MMNSSAPASHDDVMTNYKLLTQEWNAKKPNLSRIEVLLVKLKVALTGIMFMPTDAEKLDKKDLIVSRDVLEIGCQFSVIKKDIPAFERYVAQLKCYYFDYGDQLPQSVFMYQILGLNLLCLLAHNRVAEFHTELELLPMKEIQNNIYIHHPVSLEQYLMEGSYNKVFDAREMVPAESYHFFMNILLETIRVEVAACIETAYETISVRESARMLFFQNPTDFMKFASQRGWTQNGENLKFATEKVINKHTGNQIPAEDLALKTIEYARELEKIV